MIERYTISCDKSIMQKIDSAARQNYTSRSHLIKMLLNRILDVPNERLSDIFTLNLNHEKQGDNKNV